MSNATVAWIQQLGTAGEDDAYDLAVDSEGNIYVTGYTSGALAGENQGGNDAWIAKYNAEGQQLWVQQLGTAGEDESNGIAIAPDNSIYILGYTYSFDGNDTQIAKTWLAKYNSEGKQEWLKPLAEIHPQIPNSIGVDEKNNIYITGYAVPAEGDWEAWLAKYDSMGVRLWWTPLGKYHENASTTLAIGSEVSPHTGRTYINVYVAGNTSMPIAGQEAMSHAWIARYSGEGIQKWIFPLGDATETGCNDIAIDRQGYVYVSGYTEGTMGEENAGGNDAWVAKYSDAGAREWVKQLGSRDDEESTGVAIDEEGNVYLAGFTFGTMGEENAGESDAWVAKYDTDGTQHWIKQIGTSGEDGCNAVALDVRGNIYITGYTDDAMEGENAGHYDAWLAKLEQS
ncbi:MAG: SBBP repeat-containing protein [Cyanobacteria bacterium P01_E01_bin.42]